MTSVYVASLEAYSGKTGLIVSLGLEAKAQDRKVGYLKPIGRLPIRADGVVTDKDAHFVWSALGRSDPLESVCPIVLTTESFYERLQAEKQDGREAIERAYETITKGKDVVFLEGGGNLNENRFLGASGYEVAELLDIPVLLLVKFQPELLIDNILDAKDHLGDRLLGVIYNWVPRNESHVFDMIVPFLEKNAIRVFGILPRDRSLMSVSIRELADYLQGEVLTAKENVDQLVESFMVGAMGQEKALRFFQRVSEKAVITGGDRADVQLAALETPTKCLILTGRLQPSPLVMARADELGVPMILVDMDTFTAVEKTDDLVGKVRVHHPQKVERMQELIRSHIDLPALFQALSIA